jgi:starch synthase
MRVAFVAAEGAPWSRTGGLGEVTGALSAALHAPDGEAPLSVALLLPLHRESWRAAALRGVRLRPAGVQAEAWLAGVRHVFTVYRADEPGRPVYLFDAPALFDRDGIYHDAGYRSWDDNAERFAAFTKAAVAAAPELMGGPVDLFHAHDWQTGLLPAFLRMRRGDPRFARSRSLLTVHNLAHQGVFPKRLMDTLGLPWELFHVDGLEFHDRLGFLKGGLALADWISTVSPRYAREICGAEQGVGLDGLLRARADRLSGLLNGVDAEAWDPSRDVHLPARFDADDLSGKARCRAALLDELGLDAAGPGDPVLAFIGRLTWQKGADLVAALADELVAVGARLVLLGNGEPALERQLAALAARHPRRVAARLGFDLPLSHRIEAGADLFLMPSRFEPCGLNQMYSMAYGTVPVAHRTGGLADTVVDPGRGAEVDPDATGFCFDHADVAGLRWALGRALACLRERPDAWRLLQRRGMRRDWSWGHAAAPYRALYHRIVGD